MNTHRASLLLAGLACATLFAGCKGTTPSNKLAPGEIAIFLEAIDDGSGTVAVTASLEARAPGDQNYVVLAGGDQLTARYGKQGGILSEANDGHYEADFPLSDAGDVTVEFNRGKEKVASSYGVMPESVELPDFGGAVISRGLDDVVLDLPATVGSKSVDLSGPCVSSLHYDVGTSADYLTIPAGSLYAGYAQDECDVTVTVTVTLLGEPDTALSRDSTFELRRSRSASFYSVP